MHIPVIKDVLIDNEVIMFTKTFSSLIKHDVFITDSIEMLGKVTNNEIYKGIIKEAVTNLSTGSGLSKAFPICASNAFLPTLSSTCRS